MAILTSAYRNSIDQYRRYLEAVSKRPLLQASLFLVLTLILMIFLVAFALRPTLLTIAGLYGDLNKQRQVAAKLDTRIQAQATAAQNYNQIQSQLPLLDTAIPSLVEVGSWVTKLDTYASQSGVEIVTVSVSKTVVPKDVTGEILQSAFYLIIKGEYANLKSFLKAVESSRRLLEIGNVTLGKNAPLDTQLQMQITGQILYSKQ